MDKRDHEGNENQTMETGDEGYGLKRLIRRHYGAVSIFVLAFALAFAWAVYIFVWFSGMAQRTGIVPSTLGLWTMGDLVAFIVYAVFWELLLVGIPVIVIVVAGWMWWKRLPEEEWRGYHFGRGSRTARGSGGISFLFFIAFAIKVYIDGKWNVPIANFTLDYVVGSMVTILIWGLVIFGIPAVLALIWWIRRSTMSKPTPST